MNVSLTHGLSGSSNRRRSGLLLIGVVSPRAYFRDAARLAVHTLTGQSGRRVLSPEFGHRGPAAAFDRPQQDLVDRARIYLDRAAPDLELLLLFADRLEDLAAAVRDVVFDVTSNMVHTDIVPGLLLVDAADEQPDIIAFDGRLNEAIAAMPAMVRMEASLYHCRVYGHGEAAPIHFGRPYARRQCSDDAAALAADMIGAVTDLAESRMVQTVGSGRLGNRPTMTSLGSALQDFLTARSGSRWGLHSYTGSVVSTMIAELEQQAKINGNPVIRSPSEHGLACAAMGRWILDDAPFLIIVTSGMADEFKGTLANLRSARAKGFLVCADTSGGYWFPFQGTIHQEDDSLAVLRSRGLQTFHLDRPERLAEDLAKAFQAYDAGHGPVVLVATPAVLESIEPLDLDLRQSHAMEGAGESAKLQESAADAILHILNQEPVRLLWQCGSLTDGEAELIHDLAVRCGAALCDSVTRPGSVSKYRNGRVVPDYLGTLGLYATSARVHEYIHSDGKPLSGDFPSSSSIPAVSIMTPEPSTPAPPPRPAATAAVPKQPASTAAPRPAASPPNAAQAAVPRTAAAPSPAPPAAPKKQAPKKNAAAPQQAAPVPLAPAATSEDN